MIERSGIITFKGNPFTLLGPELKVGDKAPDFAVVDNGLAPVTLASSSGTTIAFSEYVYPRNTLQRTGKRVR